MTFNNVNLPKKFHLALHFTNSLQFTYVYNFLFIITATSFFLPDKLITLLYGFIESGYNKTREALTVSGWLFFLGEITLHNHC